MMEGGRGKMEDGKGKMEDGRRPKTVVHSPSSILHSPLSVSRWAPVLLWMAGIFYFSSRPNPLGFLRSFGHDIDIGNLAHIGEYAGLITLLYRALAGSEKGQRTSGPSDLYDSADSPVAGNLGITPVNGQRLALSGAKKPAAVGRLSLLIRRPPFLALSIALAYAILDELHQELTPGRGFELADISTSSIQASATTWRASSPLWG